MTAAYKGAEINRIEFDPAKPDEAALLLTNGDLIHGSLMLDKIRIEPDSFAQLAMILQNNPWMKIEIQGGTDNIGPEAYNRILSQRRAQNAKIFLIEKGIEPGSVFSIFDM
ncbi:MAG: OmpA family protein [Desulfobacterales bacterium]|jgi:hypothetical protein